MHGNIELAGKKLALQFFREQALAADLRQSAVGYPVTLGGKHDDFEHIFRQTVCRHQPVTGLVSLCERQRAAARADLKGFVCIRVYPLLPELS